MSQQTSETAPKTNNRRILSYSPVMTIESMRAKLPQSKQAIETTQATRNEICDIMRGRDQRKIVITGPCSIHDRTAALEYGQKLTSLRERYADKLLIVMRVYFEKPRTSVGWKGLINDPEMNGSYDINKGLLQARELLIQLAEMGIPAATELLDPIVAAYLGELVSWVCIGARTTESQTHRQMASGLSAPVGFKNSTEGGLMIPVHAMKAAQAPHAFLSVDDRGVTSVVNSSGNPDTHLVLRGILQDGEYIPNYHKTEFEQAAALLKKSEVSPKILVDCSHANSRYDYTLQRQVLEDIITEKTLLNESLLGVMFESNLKAGKQAFSAKAENLEYGKSITDACIDLAETESLLEIMYQAL